jgi:meiotically up-regulated gene 157 (Mug157) protein
MWLRDAAAQAAPLVRFARDDPPLRALLAGLLARMARSVLLDPYANAFSLEPDAPEAALHTSDVTTSRGVRASARGVFERKWELDSLAAPLLLAESYYNATGDATPFTDDAAWLDALALTLATMRAQQAGRLEEDAAGAPEYTFARQSVHPSESLLHGRGAPSRRTGLIKTAFRPSDDAAALPFHVPSNAAAAAALRGAARLLRATPFANATRAAALAADSDALAAEITRGLEAHASFAHPVSGARVYAYELDGYGNHLFLDDANLPSLLSLPLFGGSIPPDDALYGATRAAVLSPDTNPYFAAGSAASGVGSPHTASAGRSVWPLALITRAATSSDDGEIAEQLRLVATSSACTGLMHESFDPNDAKRFTRPWFAWANAALAELLLRLAEERPHLVLRAGA